MLHALSFPSLWSLVTGSQDKGLVHQLSSQGIATIRFSALNYHYRRKMSLTTKQAFALIPLFTASSSTCNFSSLNLYFKSLRASGLYLRFPWKVGEKNEDLGGFIFTKGLQVHWTDRLKATAPEWTIPSSDLPWGSSSPNLPQFCCHGPFWLQISIAFSKCDAHVTPQPMGREEKWLYMQLICLFI